MKTRICAIWLLLILLVLTACAGAGDWNRDLMNGYAVRRVNGEEIVFGQTDGQGGLTPSVSGYVRAFCSGNRFVGLQMSEDAQSEDVIFYLVDTEGSAVYSADNESDFQDACESLNVTDLGAWITTDKRPAGASG